MFLYRGVPVRDWLSSCIGVSVTVGGDEENCCGYAGCDCFPV